MFLFIGLALGAAAAGQPEWNLDCIGYAGVAQRERGHSDAEVYRQVYTDLVNAAPVAAVKEITTGSQYRRTIWSSADAFALQLPFYSNKPLYGWLVEAAMRYRVNSVRATFYVSAAAYGLLAVAVLLCLRRVASALFTSVFGICLMLLPCVHEVGRLGTPDALAAAFTFAGSAWLVFGERRALLAALLLMAAVCTRPDAVIVAVAVLAARASSSRAARPVAMLGMLGCVGACVIETLAIPAYSWSVLISHTFVKRVTQLSQTTAVSLQPSQYLHALGRGLHGDFVLHPPSIFLFVAITLFMRWARPPLAGDAQRSAYWRLQLALWLAVALHFLAFPSLGDRFFVAHYLIMAVTSIALVFESAGNATAAATAAAAAQSLTPSQGLDTGRLPHIELLKQ